MSDKIELETREDERTREARAAMHRYMNGFVEWAKELPPEDMKQIVQWMRDVRGSWTPAAIQENKNAVQKSQS